MNRIFMKLFAIRIVANNFFGLFNNSTISIPFSSESRLSKSDFESEKKATSVPEMIADMNNKTTSEKMPIMDDQSIFEIKNVLTGSGSNDN